MDPGTLEAAHILTEEGYLFCNRMTEVGQHQKPPETAKPCSRCLTTLAKDTDLLLAYERAAWLVPVGPGKYHYAIDPLDPETEKYLCGLLIEDDETLFIDDDGASLEPAEEDRCRSCEKIRVTVSLETIGPSYQEKKKPESKPETRYKNVHPSYELSITKSRYNPSVEGKGGHAFVSAFFRQVRPSGLGCSVGHDTYGSVIGGFVSLLKRMKRDEEAPAVTWAGIELQIGHSDFKHLTLDYLLELVDLPHCPKCKGRGCDIRLDKSQDKKLKRVPCEVCSELGVDVPPELKAKAPKRVWKRRAADQKSETQSYRIRLTDSTKGYRLHCEQLYGKRDAILEENDHSGRIWMVLKLWVQEKFYLERPATSRHRPLSWANTTYINESASCYHWDLEGMLEVAEKAGPPTEDDYWQLYGRPTREAPEALLCPVCKGIGSYTLRKGNVTCAICKGKGSTVSLTPELKAILPGQDVPSVLEPMTEQPGTVSGQELRIMYFLVETDLTYEKIAVAMGLSHRRAIWKKANWLVEKGYLTREATGDVNNRPVFRYPETLQLLVDTTPSSEAQWIFDDDEEEGNFNHTPPSNTQAPPPPRRRRRHGRQAVTVPIKARKIGGV